MKQKVIALIAVVFAVAPCAVAQVARVGSPMVTPIASHAVVARAGPVSFRKHVIPVLTKMGCNSGACHGAAAGKNGFALTLRGYTEADYDTITRAAAGRRVNKLEPAKSLLLLKPTETLPHLGGKRFDVGSPEYAVLAGWIASGMPAPRDSDATLSGISATPASETLAVGDTRQLRVEARYSDGTTEDVTRWARYGSADQSVAQVDEKGQFTVRGHGETAVSVGFLTAVALARVRSPYPNDIPPAVFDQAAQYNRFDTMVLAKLRELRIRPAGLCTDAEFIRRAYLDAAGILPTRAEVERFVDDRAPDKRTRLVDALLERPEFVDYWAYKWSDLLLVSSRSLGRSNVQSFYGWIRASVASNTPWDRFVRELTTASGRTDQVGAANYFLIHRNPIDIAENYTQAFLGLTLTCARCHNHPLEKWTQRDYYQFANLFSRVVVKDDDRAFATKEDASLVYSADTGEILHPRLGVALPPRPLDGVAMKGDARADRRAYVAAWLTSPSNTQFARTIVNRVWGSLLGRGFVHPVDDLRATNPASNEELFAALTADFVEHGFDVKRLIRSIMTSATYQRSAETDDTNLKDDRYYSHHLTRRLQAEVILDAVLADHRDAHAFRRVSGRHAGPSAAGHEGRLVFLTVFGRPERVLTSAAERQMDPTLPQALHAINGDTLNKKLMDDGGRIASMARDAHAAGDLVDEIYLSALSRPPGVEERRALAARIDAASDRRRSSRISRGPCSRRASSSLPIERDVRLMNFPRCGRAAQVVGRLWPFAVLIVCVAILACRGVSADQAPAPPDYARDVVPILEANCIRCHSPAQQEGGLLLDAYEDLMRGGDSGRAIMPRDAAGSRLVAMIEGRAKKKMPPKSELRGDEIATLRAWIDAGAPCTRKFQFRRSTAACPRSRNRVRCCPRSPPSRSVPTGMSWRLAATGKRAGSPLRQARRTRRSLACTTWCGPSPTAPMARGWPPPAECPGPSARLGYLTRRRVRCGAPWTATATTCISSRSATTASAWRAVDTTKASGSGMWRAVAC